MRVRLLSCAAVMTVLAMLGSCGGGGSSDSAAPDIDTVSITVQGVGTTVYTEATNTSASAGFSPYLTASYPTPSIGTYLFSLDWNGSSYDTRFEIHIWGGAAGTYDIVSDNAMVLFQPAGGPAYSSMSAIPDVGGTVTFTEFGSPGGKIKGSFDVISLIVGSPSQTARVTGSFSVTRQ